MSTNAAILPESVSRFAFNDDYLARLRSGDSETWGHFEAYFRRLIHIRLSTQFRSQMADELTGEVLSAVIQKIQQCALKDAAKLPAYVAGVCRNAARSAIRSLQKRPIVEVNWDAMPAHGRNPEQEFLDKEKAEIVGDVLKKLNTRDRDILVDVFYHGLDRDEACRQHRVTREQLRMILFHARQRFQREWGRQRTAPNVLALIGKHYE